jgi:hypothetical protein
MTVDLDALKAALAKIGTLPVSHDWMYHSVRHCERNMDFEDYCEDLKAETHHVPDRQCGGEIALAVNRAPAMIARIEALEAENARLRGALEQIAADRFSSDFSSRAISQERRDLARAALKGDE